MYDILKGWKKYLLSERLQDFAQDGMIKLYHYTRAGSESILLDPERFKTQRNSWSRREYNTSSFPRVFFYLDTEKTERDIAIGIPLVATVSAEDIYDLHADEENLLQKSKKASGLVVADMHKVLKSLAGKDFASKGYEEHFKPIRAPDAKIYKGVHYSINYGDTPVVAWFEEIEAKREIEPDGERGIE
jgi:hypothetical protein